jgi:uncharacterized membrane protein
VQETRDDFGLGRIAFFSDAVIAIAITLLVLDIRLPEFNGDPADQLPRALFDLWPRYGSFLLSFLVVGTYWWGHHRLFRVVRRYDETFIWLNILLLVCIAFIPFASSVLGEHGDQPSAAVFYAVVIAATGLAGATLWAYASHGHRLVDSALSDRAIRSATLRVLITPTVFLLSLPLALLSPSIARATWLAIYPVLGVLVVAERRRSIAAHRPRPAPMSRRGKAH